MKDRTSIILAVTLGGLVVFGALFGKPLHPTFPWHDVPGYMAIIGLVGCAVIALFSKTLGYKFLQRPEDYDDRE